MVHAHQNPELNMPALAVGSVQMSHMPAKDADGIDWPQAAAPLVESPVVVFTDQSPC